MVETEQETTPDNPLLKTWLLLHQTYNLVSKTENATFAKVGLTTQRLAVLMAIKYIKDPVTQSDVANWLDRRESSISMLLDRMEKDGLVDRMRDLSDHRWVRLVLTEEGEKALEQATIVGWQLVQQILDRLTDDEMQTLIRLLEKVRERAYECLNPGEVMEEIEIANEVAEA